MCANLPLLPQGNIINAWQHYETYFQTLKNLINLKKYFNKQGNQRLIIPYIEFPGLESRVVREMNNKTGRFLSTFSIRRSISNGGRLYKQLCDTKLQVLPQQLNQNKKNCQHLTA